jgi:hypothetical protein
MVSLRASFISNSSVAAPALAMAFVILSALNLTRRPSRLRIRVFMNSPLFPKWLYGMMSASTVPHRRYMLGLKEIIPLHIVGSKKKMAENKITAGHRKDCFFPADGL